MTNSEDKKSQQSPGETVDLSRRHVFPQILGNFIVTLEEVKGHRHCAYQDLEGLTREKFERLVPEMSMEFELNVSKGWLVARNRNTKEKVRLFLLDTERITSFNLLNGQNNVEKIVVDFTVETGREPEEGYAHVRQQLLDLVKLRICTFKNPVED